MYSRNIFFGNSFTEGEGNCGISFVDYLDKNCRNLGVSGTTMGSYSIYPVDGYCLLERLHHFTKLIRDADNVFLEYGINDVASLMCDFATMVQVKVAFIKAIDYIKQVNPRCNIYFLSVSENSNIIKQYAELQCDYLANDYFNGYDFIFPASRWYSLYTEIIDAVKVKVEVIPMIDDILFFKSFMSADKVHPNGNGYSRIAEKLNKYI